MGQILPSCDLRMTRDTDLIIVRRGCQERYEQLRDVFSENDVTVLWDRRSAERRRHQGNVVVDRRVKERRRPPPRNWMSLDFIVVPDRLRAEGGPTP